MANLRVVALVIIAIGLGLGFTAYAWSHGAGPFSTSRTATNNGIILDKHVSMNETNDPYNPFNPYPFESAGYEMQLTPGTYQVTLHTTGTVAVIVKMDSCYDETLYHCTRLSEGFSSSENPPNIERFSVTQAAGYTLTVSLPGGTPAITGCGDGPYRTPCPTADVEVIVTQV